MTRALDDCLLHFCRRACVCCGLIIVSLLSACSSDSSQTNGYTLNPVKLFGSTEKPTKLNADVSGVQAIKVNVDQADIKKAINRYRINAKIKTGSQKIVGADLNGDGVGEALVYFEGDAWCISIGCRLVIFAKGQNGFREMSEIKRVRLPVLGAKEATNGWRDLIVNTGNMSIGVRSVALKFNGNYPANASVMREKLAEVPLGTESLIGAETVAAGVN